MRYMLAYMLEGEAKDYHLELSDRLAEKFGLTPASRHNDPHITLKAPFDTRDISDVAVAVSTFTMTEQSTPFELTGFGDFDGRVIYKEVEAPEETHALVKHFQDQLQDISWLTFSTHEVPLTLHTTLCFPSTPEQAQEILTYLEKEPPVRFELSLDTISLLHKREGRWQTARTFKIANEPAAAYQM